MQATRCGAKTGDHVVGKEIGIDIGTVDGMWRCIWGGMRLAELGEKVGLDYASVQMAVRRLGVRLNRDTQRRKIVCRLEKKMLGDG